MARVKVDRSETAIPCMLVFTEPLKIAGLPRSLFFTLLGSGLIIMLLLKNLIAGGLIFVFYIVIKAINKNDDYKLYNLLRQTRKKYISY